MAEPIKLDFRPGISRESTDYANAGGWWDCNLMRIHDGNWASVGGWVKFTQQQAQGTYRSLFPFTVLSGERFYGAGTNLKYYLVRSYNLVDITPLRATVTINNNPFAITSGSATATVTDTSHGAVLGDFVTYSGAVSIGVSNVTAAVLNQEYQIIEIVDANTYKITLTVTSDTTSAGGGAAVVAAYQINVGLDTTVLGTGWGTGPWGGPPGWGEGSDVSVATEQLRLWSEDNFGEDLLFNVRNGGIYLKDMTTVSTRGVNITTLGDGPSVAMQIMVSDNSRHAIAFGCNPVDSSTQDRLLARWSDSEDITEWTPDTTNSAGDLRFDGGSTFLRALETTTEILVFTDTTLHSMRYTGAPYTFGQTRVGTNIQLIGPNAATSTGSEAYWMANGRFQMYDGRVRDIQCAVQDYIFSILNSSQSEKIVAGVNRQFGEVWWHLPVNGSEEVNFYVVYNYDDKLWYFGSFNDEGRTTWLDAWYESTPLAASPDGYIYAHESGATDGSAAPGALLDSYLESSPIEIGTGGDFMYVSRYIPDFDFSGSSATSPALLTSFILLNFPGSARVDGPTSSVTRTVSTPVQQFTPKCDIRFRTRALIYRVEATATGTLWKLGTQRLYASPDGQR